MPIMNWMIGNVAIAAALAAVAGYNVPPVDTPAITSASIVADMAAPVVLGSRHDVMMNGPALSPAGCNIVYVTDAHPSESVPGAMKVNVKTECKSKVSELDLAVTLLVDGKPVHKTMTKATNKAFLFNQDTWIMCKNFKDEHTFQGAAMGTSFEDEDGDGGMKPYTQMKTGRAVTLKCGI